MIYNLYSVVHLPCKPQRWSDNYYESLAHKHFCDLQFFIKQEFIQMKKGKERNTVKCANP